MERERELQLRYGELLMEREALINSAQKYWATQKSHIHATFKSSSWRRWNQANSCCEEHKPVYCPLPPICRIESFCHFSCSQQFQSQAPPPCAHVAMMSPAEFWASSVVPCVSVLVTNKVSFQQWQSWSKCLDDSQIWFLSENPEDLNNESEQKHLWKIFITTIEPKKDCV